MSAMTDYSFYLQDDSLTVKEIFNEIKAAVLEQELDLSFREDAYHHARTIMQFDRDHVLSFLKRMLNVEREIYFTSLYSQLQEFKKERIHKCDKDESEFFFFNMSWSALAVKLFLAECAVEVIAYNCTDESSATRCFSVATTLANLRKREIEKKIKIVVDRCR